MKFSKGDLIKIYIRQGKEKRGKWIEAGTVTVDGTNGKKIPAVEDTRIEITDEKFA